MGAVPRTTSLNWILRVAIIDYERPARDSERVPTL
jgi:hypothetical protein